jgi:hypothetical protein
LCEVAIVRDVWEMVFENRALERLNLGERYGFPSKRFPSDGCGFDATANG